MRPSHAYRHWIGQAVNVVIDRPLGSAHPRFPDLIYPLNQAFVPGARAGDGAEVDVHVLGVDRPVAGLHGFCIAVIHRRDDVDAKLVAAPAGRAFSDEETRAATAIQKCFFDSRLIR